MNGMWSMRFMSCSLKRKLDCVMSVVSMVAAEICDVSDHFPLLIFSMLQVIYLI